jgi:6-phosphofructo-2-kinase / fructose-2,6-biphosphatase 2
MAALYTVQGAQVLVCMCGLPARGKTYIAQKGTVPTFSRETSLKIAVQRYLTWLSIPTKSFNVGQYRREGGNEHPPATFFDPANAEGARMRELAAQEAFSDLMRWYSEEGGVVGILDATNSTKERRQWIKEKCCEAGIKLMLVESVCDDKDLVLSNILDVKVSSPDYKGQDPEQVSRCLQLLTVGRGGFQKTHSDL